MSIRIIPESEIMEFTDDDPVCDAWCDAVDCNGYVRLTDSDFDDLIPPLWTADMTEEDAIVAALRLKGWGLGTVGVQRGHVYCPAHAHMEVA